MRFATVFLYLLLAAFILVPTLHATQYPNRVLKSCYPLEYEVKPLEIYGGALQFDRYWHNDYGDCTGEPPGPPFVIEMPIIIDNVYDLDGSVLTTCSFVVDNRFGGGDPFEIDIRDEAVIQVYGNILAEGKAGDNVIFKNAGGFFNYASGGPSHLPVDSCTSEFSWCTLQASGYLASPTFDIRGSHLIMNNCTVSATTEQHGIYFTAIRDNVWDVTLNNCTFNGVDHPTTSPILLVGIRSLDLSNAVFNGCTYDASTPANGCLEVGGNIILKNLNGLSGSGNSRNSIFLNSSGVYIDDSCTIKTSNNFTACFSDRIIVDSTGTLICDKGTVLQMMNGEMSDIQVRSGGKIVLDSTVITSFADRAHGVTYVGWSTDEPEQGLAWLGFETSPGSELEITNHSRIRWADGPYSGEGRVLLDNSTIEMGWGSGINMHYSSPGSVEVRNSTIHKLYGSGEGIDFTMSASPDDSAGGRIVVDSSQITQCGGYGIYIGGGIGRPLEDSLGIRITNSNISGNGEAGIYGYFGPPADSVVILNNRLVGNGGAGLWMEDGGCDSMRVQLENNVALGNRGVGLGIETGFVKAVGNTSAYNEGYGLYYPYKPQFVGQVANNILAYNDNYGLYCYTKYGGTVPGIIHNVFWQNDDESNELYINSDDYLIHTVQELQALGGASSTNEEFTPAFRPIYRDVIRVMFYDSADAWTRIWVNSDSLDAGRLNGLAVLPSTGDTTAWFNVVRNTSDSIYIAGDIRSVAHVSDTLTVYDFHLTPQSQAIDFGDSLYVTTERDIDGDPRILDSDENGSELVDAGADEYNPDAGNVLIWVLSPTADTTLVPGESAVISWSAPITALVDIDYTIDVPLGGEPAGWMEVAHGVLGLTSTYNWEVPQVMSARCMIRISDASNEGYYRNSEIFHIKQTRLTRFATDSTYEFYSPSAHGWSFTNVATDVWPQTFWQQYDYFNGIDPYTSQAYPTGDVAYPFGYTPDSTFPSWPIFVETFGENACYNTTPLGLMYVMRAVNRWVEVSAPTFGGSCSGFSNGSLLAFGRKTDLDTDWSYLGITDSCHQLAVTDDLREFVHVLQNYYNGRWQSQFLSEHCSDNMDSTLAFLRDMFLSSTHANDASLSIYNQTLTAGHAILPWAVVPDTAVSKLRINVYDPNYPGADTLYIEVDTAANVWAYAMQPTWGGADYLFMNYPSAWCLESPVLKALAKTHAASVEADSSEFMEVLYPSDGYICFYNTEGDSIGVGADGGYCTIDSAAVLPPLLGPGGQPFTFVMPNEKYDIVISGVTDTLVRFGCYYDSLYVGYSRSEADSTQTDSLALNGDLRVHNTDAETKNVELRMARTLIEGERAVVLNELSVSTGDSIALEPIDTSGWYLSNPGGARTYRLWMREVNGDGESKFAAHDVPIDSGVAHLLTPDWSTLSADSCTIYIDTDGDQLADDSLQLQNDFVTDVEDDDDVSLPFRFELHQNYPNPFNPSTTIEYELPVTSHVTVEIFNVLGQRVRVLVDRTDAAGTYLVEWDGTTEWGEPAATGVYLYRFRAGSYTETKKMMLVK